MLRVLILAISVCYVFVAAAEQSLPGNKDVEAAAARATDLLSSQDMAAARTKAREAIKDAGRAGAFAPIDASGQETGFDLSSLDRSAAPGWIKDALAGAENIKSRAADPVGVIVLISASMPKDQISRLLKQSAQYNGMVAIRGLIDNDFEKTVATMRSLANEDAGVAIDPTMFRRFNVESVPAFILPLETLDPCTPTDCSPVSSVIASGSMDIGYFLNKVSENNEGKAKARAQSLLEAAADD